MDRWSASTEWHHGAWFFTPEEVKHLDTFRLLTVYRGFSKLLSDSDECNSDARDMGRLTRSLWTTDKKGLVILLIFVCAMVVRLSYVTETRTSVLTERHFHLDPLTHDLLAMKIATESFWGEEPFFRAPLYPYFLGVLYVMFGHRYLIPRLVQVLIGSLSCVLAFLIGRRIFGASTALLGALLACFYWILIYYDGEFLIPVLSVFLNLAFLWVLLRKEKFGWRSIFTAGVLVGVSALARPNILVFVPCIIMWIAVHKSVHRWKRTAVLGLALVAGVSVAVGPVTVRNYLVGHDVVLISSQGGVNFFIGNNSKSDGKTPVQPAYISPYEDSQFMVKHKEDVWVKDNVWRVSKIVAEKALGRELRPSEISDFWYGQAFQFIRRRPCSFLGLVLKKIYFLWNAYEIPSNDDIYRFAHQHSRILTFLSHLHFGVLGPLSLLGMGLGLREWRRYLLLYLYVVSYGFSIVLFFVTARYRVPLLPILFLFSSHAIVWVAEAVRNRRYRKLTVATLVLLVLFLVMNSNLFTVREQIIRLHHELGW